MLKVVSNECINDAAVRVTLEKDVSIDIPNICDVAFNIGDAVKIVVNPDDNNKMDCVMQGIVYDSVDQFSFISCGGLLIKLNKVLEPSTHIKIGLSKSRRRTTRTAESAPSTRSVRKK